MSNINFYVEASDPNYFDIYMSCPQDSEYPIRVLSFTSTGISFQKRDAHASWSSRVTLWTNT